MHREWAVVESIQCARPGLLRLSCRMGSGECAPAVAYPSLCGEVAVGDRVLLNTTAIDLRLGSGGCHFVIAASREAEGPAPLPGHIIKMRYTPLQAAVLSVEEEASPHHYTMREADSLDGMPVVCCELLSQAPAVLAGLRSAQPCPSVCLVLTDEAALNAAYIDVCRDLREAGLIALTITTGQAHGGDLEAVNLHTGLLAARQAAGVDVAIVTPGPGTVGTHTRWGFSGVRQGEALNAAHALDGRPVGVVRASAADARERHRGISHHTRTVFSRVCTAPFAAGWPDRAGMPFVDDWCRLLRETNGRLEGFLVDGTGDALDRFEREWRRWPTMGRIRAEDPLFYEAAAAAGMVARRLWRGEES